MGLIHFGEGNISGVLTPLIPFNCIFDTDFGLLALIDRSYLDKSKFSVDFFIKNKQIRSMVKAISEREKENPLSLCLLEDSMNLADELYSDFISKKYQDILNLSMPTEVYNILELFKLGGDVKPTIVYESNIEEDFLQKFKVTKNIQRLRIDEIDFKLYEQYYFKSINDFYCNTLSDFLDTKKVYIANYKFNLSINDDGGRELIENKNTLSMQLSKNRFTLFNIYDKSKLE